MCVSADELRGGEDQAREGDGAGGSGRRDEDKEAARHYAYSLGYL